MTSNDSRDRLIDTLLREVLGGETPPDLREKILRRAAAGRRAWGGLTVGIAAAILLAIGAWIVFQPPPKRKPIQVAAPETIVDAPLPEGAQGFQGFLAGTIVSIDGTGLILKVIHASPRGGSKALDPRWLEGRTVRLLFTRFGNEPSRDLIRQAEKLREQHGPVTAEAWAERDEALIVTRLRAGDHTGR